MTTDNDRTAARMLRGAAIALIASIACFLMMLVLLVSIALRSADDPIVDRARMHCVNLAADVRRGRVLDELLAGDATWVCTGSWEVPTDPEAWARALEAGR